MPSDGQEGQRVVFFFLILFFIYLQPNNPPQRIHFGTGGFWDTERQRDFDVLANTTYGEFVPGKQLNLTAFREEDGHRWELLPKVQSLSRQQFTDNWRGLNDVAFYREISGDVRGDFRRSALSIEGASSVNLTALDPRKDYILEYFQRNITENEGEISVSFKDDETTATLGQARTLSADVSIWAESAPGSGWQVTLHGVHLPNGAAILTTSSTKFDALPALPHFALDETSFNAATPVMNDTVAKAWQHTYLRETEMIGVARCEMIIWLQPKPLLGSANYIEMIENELIYPKGAPIGPAPAMSFSMVLFSPDCGYVLEAPSLDGAKTEVFTALTNRLLFAFMILLALQIALLKRQMKKSSTPSTRSRIAYPSIVIAALGDGLIMFLMVLLLSLNDASFMLIACVIFLSCIHMAFLEVKFVFDLWNIQVGEPQHAEAERERREYIQRRQQAQQQAQPPSATTNETSAPQADSQTAPTAPPTSNIPQPPLSVAPAPRVDTGASPIPVFMPSDQDDLEPVVVPANVPPTTPGTLLPMTTYVPPPPTPRSTFATIYARFYFTLIMLLLFSLLATSFPRPFRSFLTNLFAFAYFSLWLPQIHRNILRNCRKALTWEYVVGGSIFRAVPVLYWYFAEGNLLGVKTSPSMAVLLAGWLALQVAVLAGQRVWGGRWVLCGVRAKWLNLPKAWEYHPLLVDVPGSEPSKDIESAGAEESLLGGAGKQGLEEGEMSVNLLASAGEAKEDLDETQPTATASNTSRRTFDCAICMNEIDVPVVHKRQDPESGKGKGLGMPSTRGLVGLGFERAGYMVTPCRHIFHAECLEGWMGLRLVCPVCREELPPL